MQASDKIDDVIVSDTDTGTIHKSVDAPVSLQQQAPKALEANAVAEAPPKVIASGATIDMECVDKAVIDPTTGSPAKEPSRPVIQQQSTQISAKQATAAESLSAQQDQQQMLILQQQQPMKIKLYTPGFLDHAIYIRRAKKSDCIPPSKRGTADDILSLFSKITVDNISIVAAKGIATTEGVKLFAIPRVILNDGMVACLLVSANDSNMYVLGASSVELLLSTRKDLAEYVNYALEFDWDFRPAVYPMTLSHESIDSLDVFSESVKSLCFSAGPTTSSFIMPMNHSEYADVLKKSAKHSPSGVISALQCW